MPRSRKAVPGELLRIYGGIAKQLAAASHEERVRMLARIHTETVECTIEAACTELSVSGMESDTVRQVRQIIAKLTLKHAVLDDNRNQLRRLESYFLAAGLTEINATKAAEIFARRDGIDVFFDPVTDSVQIVEQPEKWLYE